MEKKAGSRSVGISFYFFIFFCIFLSWDSLNTMIYTLDHTQFDMKYILDRVGHGCTFFHFCFQMTSCRKFYANLSYFGREKHLSWVIVMKIHQSPGILRKLVDCSYYPLALLCWAGIWSPKNQDKLSGNDQIWMKFSANAYYKIPVWMKGYYCQLVEIISRNKSK